MSEREHDLAEVMRAMREPAGPHWGALNRLWEVVRAAERVRAVADPGPLSMRVMIPHDRYAAMVRALDAGR